MSSTQATARLAEIETQLKLNTPKMASLEHVQTSVAASSPVTVDNEIKGRLALVTGASGGLVVHKITFIVSDDI